MLKNPFRKDLAWRIHGYRKKEPFTLFKIRPSLRSLNSFWNVLWGSADPLRFSITKKQWRQTHTHIIIIYVTKTQCHLKETTQKEKKNHDFVLFYTRKYSKTSSVKSDLDTVSIRRTNTFLLDTVWTSLSTNRKGQFIYLYSMIKEWW